MINGVEVKRKSKHVVSYITLGVQLVVFCLVIAVPGPVNSAVSNVSSELPLACNITQITNTTGASGEANFSPSINADGTRIAFVSTRDLTGENADLSPEIFFFDTTGTFTQITKTIKQFPLANASPSINAAGTRIAFASDRDLTGENPGSNIEIFLFDTITGAFTQITKTRRFSRGFSQFPSINADGTRIAFVSINNLTGENADLTQEIFLFDTTTGTFTQITKTIRQGPPPSNVAPSINADGTRIAFVSTNNLTGENADLNPEIFLFDTTTGTFTQITKTTEGDSDAPSINGDGTRIAFESLANLTEGNAEHNRELFLSDATTSTFTQVTNSTERVASRFFFDPSINSDGTRIAFQSLDDLTGENADLSLEIFLFDTTTGAFTQITNTTRQSFDPSINSDGTRIAFQSFDDLTGANADLNLEIFLAKCAGTVNNLVSRGSLRTSFDPSSIPNGPAGTFTITAIFTNTSSTPIGNPFFEVTELAGGNLLLNADGAPGGVGATVTPDVGADGVLLPGDSFTVDFLIGLQQRKRFIFLIDLMGFPGQSEVE